MGITPTFLVVALSLFIKIIYKQLTLTAIHRIDPLIITPNPPHPSLAFYLVRIINKGEALAYNCP